MKKYSDHSDETALFIAVPDVGKEAAFRAAEPQAEPCLGLWEGMAEVAYVMARPVFRSLERLGLFDEQEAVVVLSAKNAGPVRGRRYGWVVDKRNGEGKFYGPRWAQRTKGFSGGNRWTAYAGVPPGPGYTFIPSTGLFYALR